MRRCLLAAAALCLLAGCAPHAREPEGLALVRVLGVEGRGPVTLTAVCGAENGEEPARGQASAASFSAARAALPWCGKEELALTNLSYLIINEETDLEMLLVQVLNDQELSPSVTLWFAEGPAELLAECSDPAGRLQVLSDRGAGAPTVVEALAELKGTGVVRLPVLTEEAGRLEAGKTVLWRDDG